MDIRTPTSQRHWASVALTLALSGGMLGCLLAGPAFAEEAPSVEETGVFYRWIDQQGRVQYTDFEPVGVPSETVRLQPEVEETGGITIESAGAARQPDPFHDQDQQVLPIEHIGPCANARQQLAVLHARLPVYRAADGSFRSAWRGDAYRGDRDYLDDDTRQAAMGAANREVLARCSDPEAFRAEVRAFRESLDSGPVSPEQTSAPPGKSSP